MNAFVKSAVAGAAGIALLLGGAGTFAVWNSSASASAGVLRTGQLTLSTTPGTGQWKDLKTGSPLSDAELSSYRTPIPGLFLTGASTHPGGGVFGASGRSAARVVARALRKA